jgi:sugar/nucleoside kinase (ribokinase family)
MTRAAQIARDAGAAVVSDLERDEWPGFEELLALVDHLIVNQAFAAKRTGCVEAAPAARKLWRPNRQAVVVTCGASGSWWIGDSSSEARHQPAYAVNAVDTTGCGDVFHGAYVAALARGLELEERVRIASAAAALKATRPGGQSSPRWEEVDRMMKGASSSTD